MNYVKGSILVLIGILLLIGCRKKAEGHVDIYADKTEVDIYIDGKRVGQTPAQTLDSFGISLEAGTHTVRCVKGLKEGVKIVCVTARSTQLVEIELNQFISTTKSSEKVTMGEKVCEERVPQRKRERDTETVRLRVLRLIRKQLVNLESGSFLMGSPTSEKGHQSNELQHRVTLTKSFKMGKYEVTQEQYRTIMNMTPSRFKGDFLPVEEVSWHEAVKFCEKLTKWSRAAKLIRAHEKYTLPTEAQWEYACHAGTTGRYTGSLGEMAWYHTNSGYKTHQVGTKRANIWGLFDMRGNVWEWCLDWEGDYPSRPCTDPRGPVSGTRRVFRGGGWGSYCEDCRSASRDFRSPDYSYGNLGFRVVLVTLPSE